MNKTETFYVVCLDEAGAHVFATHQIFESWGAAYTYLRTVSETRKPIIVRAMKDFYTK